MGLTYEKNLQLKHIVYSRLKVDLATYGDFVIWTDLCRRGDRLVGTVCSGEFNFVVDVVIQECTFLDSSVHAACTADWFLGVHRRRAELSFVMDSTAATICPDMSASPSNCNVIASMLVQASVIEKDNTGTLFKV